MPSVSLESRPKADSSSAMSVGSDAAESTTPNTSDCMSEGVDSDNDNFTANAVAERDSSGLSDAETERGSTAGEPSRYNPTEGHVSEGGVDLPHLVLRGCTRSALYLLSPFASATLVDCRDCDVVLGPVAGVVAGVGLVLVGGVVLLVDDYQPESCDRREHG